MALRYWAAKLKAETAAKRALHLQLCLDEAWQQVAHETDKLNYELRDIAQGGGLECIEAVMQNIQNREAKEQLD
jgi:hypothetical protein